MPTLPGSKTDKRKQSLYFPESMLQEIKEEAARLDRSLSWVVQRAWKISRTEIKKLPSVNDVDGSEDEEGGWSRTTPPRSRQDRTARGCSSGPGTASTIRGACTPSCATGSSATGSSGSTCGRTSRQRCRWCTG